MAACGAWSNGLASADSGTLPPCTKDLRATVNPQQTPTGVDLNAHHNAGFDYETTGCNLVGNSTNVLIENLDSAAVSGTFEGDGDGFAYLHLEFNRSAIPPGSNDIRVVIHGPLVRTSVLTLTLDKRSPAWIAVILTLLGFVGGLLLFGLRSLTSSASWWKVWTWKAFRPVAGVLVLLAAAGASISLFFKGLPTDWTASGGGWSYFLKVGTAVIAAAAAIEAAAAAKQTKQ